MNKSNYNFGVFQDLMIDGKRKTYPKVLCTIKDMTDRTGMQLDLIGPFLFFYTSSNFLNPTFMIFTENYETNDIANHSSATAILKSKYSNTTHHLYFQEKRLALDFLREYNKSVKKLHQFMRKLTIDKLSISEKLKANFPHVLKTTQCFCVLQKNGPNSYSFQAHSENNNHEISCLFDFNFDKDSFVSPIFNSPHALGKNQPSVKFFTIRSIVKKDSWGVFLCEKIDQCIRWILSIYGWMSLATGKYLKTNSNNELQKILKNSTDDSEEDKEEEKDNSDDLDNNSKIDSFQKINEDSENTNTPPVDSLDKSINLVVEDIEISEPERIVKRPQLRQRNTSLKIITSLSPVGSGDITFNTPLSPNSTHNSSFNSGMSSPFNSTTSPPMSPSSFSRNSPERSIAANPNHCVIVSPKSRDRSRANSVKILSGKKDNDKDNEKPQKEVQTHQKEIVYDPKLHEELKMVRKVSIDSLPTVEFQVPTITSQMVSSTSFDEKAVSLQIKNVLDSIDSICTETSGSQIFDNLEICDTRSTDDIINKLRISSEQSPNESIKQLTPINFPEFHFELLFEAEHPSVSIVTEFATIAQEILVHAQQDFVYESANSKRLCFLISSLFVNGIQNFITFKSTCPFLESIEQLSHHVDGLYSIYKKIKEVDNLSGQVSCYSIELLNHQIFLPVISAILANEEWQEKFYTRGSFLRNEDTMNNIYFIFDSALSKLSFRLELSHSIIGSTSSEDKASFIFMKPFLYLEFNDIDFNGEESQVKEDVVQYFMNQLKSGCIKKNPWTFVLDVAESHHVKDLEEFDYFVDYVKKVTKSLDDNSKLKKMTQHALRLKTLHLWFAFMFTNPNICTAYYRPDTSLCDLYRAKHVFSYILRYQSM
ncbi:hypothetical protein TRFO_20964 [Tritrichomonas foetus]|uniref:RUN domain-containing protein n=1 Tax=Tritrichomonas foetus TaxID=1144522 RepID=A0A1J4KGA8_9EUKA|nr:hypothetical protein TRFO_20964 [Tritrichomonas foetus]|eukprot:OHT09976.1 hypothetical protein TRFO_20964 [Tritrichomonas foetus]